MEVINFTAESVAAIPFADKDKRIIYRDEKDRYLHVQVSHKTKTFMVIKKAMGRTFYVTLGNFPNMTVKDARRESGKKVAELQAGVNPTRAKKERAEAEIQRQREEKAKRFTLEDALKEYLEDRDLKESTKDGYKRLFNLHLSDWLNKPVYEISRDMVKERHKLIANGKRQRQTFKKKVVVTENDGATVQTLKRDAEKSPKGRNASADGTMRVLRAVLNHAFADDEEDGRERINPVRILSKKKSWYKVGRRQTLIKNSDLPRWYRAVKVLENPDMRDFLLMLAFTGLRRNEAARLKWSNVDFEEKAFTVVDTKNRQPHALPMSKYVFELLSARLESAAKDEDGKPLSPYVFPSGGKAGYLQEPKRAIDAVTEATGIIFSCHDLRRTFETIAESLDLSKYTLKALLNHKQEKGDVTAGYIILNLERLREPAQRVADTIMEKVNNGSGKVIPLKKAKRGM